ncbi:calcium/calmodulin-dependent protein kinase type IV-like [Liolophura sinensis]|uniref:calcium/calmodulin-dependent protein kinase type IV-like n=1 Tax=Liolophura sinensis TaxID=3198878 RepID=UPI00315873CB
MPRNQAPGGYWIYESIKDVFFEERYNLGVELGKGGTAKVFICQNKASGENWAVKIIEKKIDKKIVRTETGILLKLNHPNVIRLKEIYETHSTIYLVLELVTGGELFDRIVSRGHYSEKDAALCVKEMLTGVKYLHDNGVVHRDLKPENFLYEKPTAESKLKVADFGLSTIIRPQVDLKTVCGTPGYCAPEVLSGTTYGQAVDMWSIGVITYILLCGYEPFFGETERELFRNIRKCNYKFDSPWWSGVSINARDLIERLLVVDPKKRLTADQALLHPWVKGVAAKSEHMKLAHHQLKEFNAKRKLKAATGSALVAARVAQKINVTDIFSVPEKDKNTPVSKLLSA